MSRSTGGRLTICSKWNCQKSIPKPYAPAYGCHAVIAATLESASQQEPGVEMHVINAVKQQPNDADQLDAGDEGPRALDPGQALTFLADLPVAVQPS
jgi:hypothetical protein